MNELRCDEARAAFDDALGGLDPLSCPVGSTNTVWEHYVYTGTTNGAFALPQSTESVSVLRVAVSGFGRGELLVGGRAVPLAGEGSTNTISHGATEARSGSLSLRASVAPCEASTQRQVLLQVPRGQTVPLYLRADGTLSVTFSSDDFAFGVLPDLAASRLSGRINFPNVTATTPCFHDYVARQTAVSLPVGEDADALACAWTGTASVAASNVPPRSAVLTGNFDGRTTAPITYALSHPEYLFGRTTHSQTARFCPPPPDADDEETQRRYGDGDGEDAGKTCWHCAWGKCGQDCDCCASCRHGDDSSDDVPDGPDADDYAVAVTNWPHLGGVLKIREPLRYDRSVFLAVPGGAAPRCCPCPSHATNHVALVCRSSQLKVVDGGGRDFRSSTESTTVRIAGVSPSLAVGDAYVAFATNGAVCLDGEFTVLGVGVRKPGVDLAALNARNLSFGLPVPATTNLLDAATLELVTKVGLPGGNVHVGFEGASAPFALWVWDAAAHEYRHLVSSDDGGSLDVSLSTWRKLVGVATDVATSRTAVRVTAEGPGAADLVFRYWAVVGGKFVEDTARQRLTAVDSPLRADVDRDGKIDAADAALSRMGRPFRFWTNEDTEKGDYVGQVADATPNASDLKVNGRLDIVNLFPVTVDVSQFRRAWGAAATARLRASSSARLRYCVLGDGFSSENALGLATAEVATADGTPIESATLTPLGDEGVDVGALSGGSLSSPVALAFEATRSVGGGLTLEILVGGNVVYSCALPLSISSVRNLYRFYSLRGAEDFADGAFPLPPRPWAETPADEKDVDVFFVHGFNVSEADARAWGDAVFKRLWMSGSRARLHVVTWNGNYNWMGDWANGLHYHQDVYHALKTGDALRRLIEREQPDSAKRVLMAHSLGGLVACEAMKRGLRVGKCFLFNAAVASECLDATLQDSDEGVRERYVPSDWTAYDPLSWAANWHKWFMDAAGDARARLGWVGRYAVALGNADEAFNYYSSGDEVFAEAANPPWLLAGVTESTASYAWQKQETLKGSRFLAGTAHGGWGFHTWRVAGFDYRYAAAEAAAMVADGSVTNSPVFNRGYAPMLDPAATDDEVAYALAKYVPAVSSPLGRFAALGFEENNADLNESRFRAKWTDDVSRGENWRHSDIKDMAYSFAWPLYFELVNEKGQLK